MILVDTSVWIDFFNGRPSPQAQTLDSLLGVQPLGIGDLILTEVLQGFRSDSDYRAARRLLASLVPFEMLGMDLALKCADHFRALRRRGITIRKTADVIIATFCLENGHALLFSDRDFQPFVDHLGLQAVV
jgi:predicted nucleic acid-binding protein